MNIADKQAPGPAPFVSMGLAAELPPHQDLRDLPEPPRAQTVETYWNGMLERSFLDICPGAMRIQGLGNAIQWTPKGLQHRSRVQALGGAFVWTSISSVLEGTAGGALTYRSYLRAGTPGIPDWTRADLLETCNSWNATRCWPQAALVDWPQPRGGTAPRVVLSSHLRVFMGVTQAQVDAFIDDCMEGADDFWSTFLADGETVQ